MTITRAMRGFFHTDYSFLCDVDLFTATKLGRRFIRICRRRNFVDSFIYIKRNGEQIGVLLDPDTQYQVNSEKKRFIQLLKYDYELCFYLNLYTFSSFALSSSFLASELLFLQPKEQKLLQCILLAGALFRWTENKIRMDSDEGSNRYEMGILELLIALDEYRIFDNAITIGLVIIHIFTIH